MGKAPASAREVAVLERLDRSVLRFEDEWRQGRPDLDRHLADSGPDVSVSLTAALVKVDLRCRYERGERPDAAEYLDRYPDLRATGERVLSLVYEEYCLREERGEKPDTAEFCARYGPWRDSLESQLRYHRVLSGVVGLAPPPPRFPAPGERFGPFLIGAELGRGGAGRVYLARDESLGGREVALKVSHDRGSEPSIQGRLKQDHIVPVHTVVYQERDGTKLRGLCMPYLPGLPLDEVILRVVPAGRPARARALHDALRADPRPPGALDPGRAGWDTFPTRGSYAEGVAWVVAVLAEALAYAHGLKIYHRDVKPANVLLTFREGPQLLDFNLSHDPLSGVEDEASLRGGTLPYMAPEHLRAFRDSSLWGQVAAPADIYSLGLVLRELLTGQAPETPDPMLPLPRAISALLDRRADFRPDLRDLNPRIPHALDAIAGKCLAFAPDDRYHDAGALAEDLRRFLARRPLKYARNRSRRERAANWAFRNRTPLAAVILLSAFAAAAAAKSLPGRPVPVENRQEFIQAVVDLNENHPVDALENLKRLGWEAERSPLVTFYTAAAYARANRVKEADVALERCWSRPGAEAVLVGRGRAHPALAHEAEMLGRDVLKKWTQVEVSRQPAALGGVERTFRLVLRLDPENYWARQGLAIIDEGRKNDPSAHKALTALIESLGTPRTSEGQQHLINSLQTRARVSTRWARSFADPAAAKAHLDEAVGDLDRGDLLARPDDRETHFELGYIRCEVTLDRAGVATRGGRLTEAIDLYREAERLLNRLSAYPPGRKSAYDALATKVNKVLRIEMPRLNSLIQVNTPRSGE